MRSDPEGESEGPFSDLCQSQGIDRDVTPADSPEFNGVAGRTSDSVRRVGAMSARIQAQELYGEDVSD